MICTVKYYNDVGKVYTGEAYTYRTPLPLKRKQMVLAPVWDDDQNRTVLKKAIVTEIDLPESCIKEEWADRVKWITKYDTEMFPWKRKKQQGDCT